MYKVIYACNHFSISEKEVSFMLTPSFGDVVLLKVPEDTPSNLLLVRIENSHTILVDVECPECIEQANYHRQENGYDGFSYPYQNLDGCHCEECQAPIDSEVGEYPVCYTCVENDPDKWRPNARYILMDTELRFHLPQGYRLVLETTESEAWYYWEFRNSRHNPSHHYRSDVARFHRRGWFFHRENFESELVRRLTNPLTCYQCFSVRREYYSRCSCEGV